MSANQKQKKIDPSQIGFINYDYRTKEMKIFNKKSLLLYVSVVEEIKFNEAGNKLFAYLEEKTK